MNLTQNEDKKINNKNINIDSPKKTNVKNILIKNDPKKNINNENKQDIIKENKISAKFEDMNIKFKEYLTLYVKNDYSLYPSLKGSKYGETKLQDIYNYLESEEKNPNKKKGPVYIEEAIETNKKEKEKYRNAHKKNIDADLIKKINKNTNNIKNMKKEFRKTAKQYLITEKKDLYYKRVYKIKNILNGLYEEKHLILKVPTVKELNEKLYEYHADNFHCNYKEVQNKFKQNKIGYYGINSLIEEYISNCTVCVQSSRTIHRKDPVKSIDIEGPNIRYEFDITYFNNDLADAYGVKMILSVIDAFSRKAMIYKIKDKKADSLITHILEYCANNSFPKEFCSDNGPEFKNSKFDEICQREGITFIHGIPYNPHSQGTVERFHYTIKKYLGKEYINNGYKKLNFDSVRIKIINFYNNKIHRLIGMSPIEASKLTDKDEIKRVNELKQKEFEKINKKRTFLKENDTCLLNPKFLLIGKKTLIPNFVKKGKIHEKIPIKIVNNSSFGYYHIKIYTDYKAENNHLKVGEEYIADSKLLKKINEKPWQAILNQKKK